MRLMIVALLIVSLMYGEEEWALIANSCMSESIELTPKQIRLIFLKKRRYLQGRMLVPLQLPPEHVLRRTFERNILGMNRIQWRAYWIRRHYLGERPPRVIGSVLAAIAFVETICGAVAYVPREDALDANATILYETSVTLP